MLHEAAPYTAQLLERGVRVLLYAGSYDLICNWVGNEIMSRSLEWTGQDAYGKAEMKEWMVDGRKAGKVRSYGPLTFATIYAAGHLVSRTCVGSNQR
jgi:carboxypeptidase C (cathepsin A)